MDAMKKGFPRLLGVWIFLSFFVPTMASPQEPDGGGSNAEVRTAAERGDPQAQYRWAMRLYFGRGMAASDKAAAVVWWQKSAEQGHAYAQFWLGNAYERGEGVARDYAEAMRWYRTAADQGNSAAQGSVGDLYAKGRGVPRDDSEAVRWYRKAADQSDAAGQYALGEMTTAGRGVARDPKEAARWYSLAADSGYTAAQVALGESYERGNGRPKDLVCAYFWYGFAAKLGWEWSGEKRDAMAPKLTGAELAFAKRLIENASYSGEGQVQRALCADETISVSVQEATLAELLPIFAQVSGREIVPPADAALLARQVGPIVEERPWQQVLEVILAKVGLRFDLQGESLRLLPLE